MKQLKLTVEPVPVTSAGKSLSALLPKSRWDKIRKRAYAEYGYRCAICGADPKDPDAFSPKIYFKDLPKNVLGLLDTVWHHDLEAYLPEDVRGMLENAWVSEEGVFYRPSETGFVVTGGLEPPPYVPPNPKYRLECHEEWEYDEATRTQRLSKLLALCTPCHQIKHLRRKHRGWSHEWWDQEWVRRAPRWYDEEELARTMRYDPFYALEGHFMKVNGCDLATMREHVNEAAKLWERRSRIEWWVDFGEFARAF